MAQKIDIIGKDQDCNEIVVDKTDNIRTDDKTFMHSSGKTLHELLDGKILRDTMDEIKTIENNIDVTMEHGDYVKRAINELYEFSVKYPSAHWRLN